LNKIIHGTWQDELPKLSDNSVDLIIVDPPYIVTKEKWDRVDQVNNELSNQLFRILKPSGSFYCWGGIGEKSQTIIDWFLIFKNTGWYFKDWITWKKQRGMGMRKGWLYTREEILWFVKDNKQFYWNKEYQYHNFSGTSNATKKRFKEGIGLRISNVWADIKEEKLDGKNKIGFHFTPKPIKAIKRIVLAHTKEKDTVLDCFLGSGTTAQVCKELNRNCIGIEKEKEHYDYCVKNFE